MCYTILYYSFFLDMPFQSRKSLDFYYWCLVLHFHKFGYFYLSEGCKLSYKISNSTNKNRYCTNLNLSKNINLVLPSAPLSGSAEDHNGEKKNIRSIKFKVTCYT